MYFCTLIFVWQHIVQSTITVSNIIIFYTTEGGKGAVILNTLLMTILSDRANLSPSSTAGSNRYPLTSKSYKPVTDHTITATHFILVFQTLSFLTIYIPFSPHCHPTCSNRLMLLS